jgi:hypothetical protein
MFPFHHYNTSAGRTHHAHLISMVFKAARPKHQLDVRIAHLNRLYQMMNDE